MTELCLSCVLCKRNEWEQQKKRMQLKHLALKKNSVFFSSFSISFVEKLVFEMKWIFRSFPSASTRLSHLPLKNIQSSSSKFILSSTDSLPKNAMQELSRWKNKKYAAKTTEENNVQWLLFNCCLFRIMSCLPRAIHNHRCYRNYFGCSIFHGNRSIKAKLLTWPFLCTLFAYHRPTRSCWFCFGWLGASPSQKHFLRFS